MRVGVDVESDTEVWVAVGVGVRVGVDVPVAVAVGVGVFATASAVHCIRRLKPPVCHAKFGAASMVYAPADNERVIRELSP